MEFFEKEIVMTQYEFEENLLSAVDAVVEQTTDITTKMIADLFKSAVLKKYKVAFDQELIQGGVHRKIIDKAVEFCYSEICFSIRQLPNSSDDDKEKLIEEGKKMKSLIKGMVEQILVNKGIIILSEDS